MKEIQKTRLLVFDLEMTGLSPDTDSIIEIGAVPLLGLANDGDYFFTPVQPYTKIHAYGKKIHGLDGDKLAKAPPAEIALPQFFKLMRGRILIGQNPSLDLAFLWKAAKTIGGNIDCDWAIDISKLFAEIHPDQKHFSLDSMTKKLHIESRRDFHNALEDAIIVAKIMGKIFPQLQKSGIYTIEQLVSIGKTRMKRF